MSRLAEVLEQKPFILMASLPKNSLDLAKAAEDAGADVIKVHANVSHFASGTTFGSFSEERATFASILKAVKIPVGLVPGGDEAMCTLDEIRAAAEMGFDFWDVFWHHAPLYLFDADGLGRMMAIDSTFIPERVEHVSQQVDLIEGSVIPQTGYRQTLRAADLGTYYQLCAASRAPVAIPTQRAVLPDELRYLRDAGARGLVIGAVVTGHDPSSLSRATASFRAAIDTL